MKAVALIPPRAQYPALYHAARAALFRCDQVDECAEWSNRAAAIASYAKQADDKTLEDIAKRIRARAVRRMGELLEKIPHGRGIKTEEGRAQTRTGVARAAGVTPFQQSAALQVARLSEVEFERQVEATPPATLARLSDLGTTRRGGKNKARHLAPFSRVARFCKETDPAAFRANLTAAELSETVAGAHSIIAWCTAFLEEHK